MVVLAVLSWSALVRAGAGAAAQATIRLRPSHGPPTSVTTVSGRGFGPTEKVRLSFDGAVLGLAMTDADGSFAKGITVPSSALPGGHTATATGQRSGRSAWAPFTIRTDWRDFRFDVANTGFNPYENVLDPSNVSRLQLGWVGPAARSHFPQVTSPVVAKGVLYVGGWGSFRTYALDAATGAERWAAGIDGAAATSPAVAGGIVYVPTTDESQRAWFDAVDAATGHIMWTAGDNIDGMVSTPTVVGTTVFDELDCLCAFDAGTGTLKWSDPFYGQGAPAFARGVVYATELRGVVHAVDAATGAVIWTYPTGDTVWSQAAVSGGSVYVGSDDGFVYALDAATGQLRWKQATGGPIQGGPAVAEGVVYAGSEDGSLYAFEASTGTMIWSAAIGSLGSSTPAVADGVVYAGTEDGMLVAVDAATGDVLWSYRIDDPPYWNASSPIVADGRLYYVGSQVFAFQLGQRP
jgi:outer membrane protein assembly factor BamB